MSILSFSTDRIVAVLITKPTTNPSQPAMIKLIGRLRNGAGGPLADIGDWPLVPLKSPSKIEFDVPRDQTSVFAIETNGWEPGYDLTEMYYLGADWPFNDEDLPYDSNNVSDCRQPQDTFITVTYQGNTLTWSSPAMRAQSLDLSKLNGKSVFFSVRLAPDSDPVKMNVYNGTDPVFTMTNPPAK